MALGWNGDALAAAAEKPVNYVVGKEGGEFWVDSYVIPVGAKNPDAAHEWIDFVYDPKHNALETAYTYYGSPLKRALLKGKLDPKILDNTAVFPAARTLANLEPNKVTPKGTATAEPDLDRVQERVGRRTRRRPGAGGRRARSGGPRYPGLARPPAPSPGMRRSSSPRSASSSPTASRSCRGSPTSRSSGTSTTTARCGTRSTARSSCARSGWPSSGP